MQVNSSTKAFRSRDLKYYYFITKQVIEWGKMVLVFSNTWMLITLMNRDMFDARTEKKYNIEATDLFDAMNKVKFGTSDFVELQEMGVRFFSS